MAAKAKLADGELVAEHINGLESEVREIVESIRNIILSTDKDIGERIKWNNPSFYYTGEMKDFDPKEYKRDMIVMNLYKGRVMLVFPSGARISDTSGLLTGDYKDGRRVTVFTDLQHVKDRENDLRNVVKVWLSKIEK